MKILITYDVSRRHTEVKNEMLTRGFHDSWEMNDVIYNLPNTTLWHPNLENTEVAVNIFNNVIEQLNLNQTQNNKIKIERVIAVDFNISSGISGEPHA